MKLSTMGGRIKAGCLERGYSVRQLAAHLGVKPANVGNWESGRSETAAVHRKLERATALQRELAALLNEATGDIARLQSELDAGKRRAA